MWCPASRAMTARRRIVSWRRHGAPPPPSRVSSARATGFGCQRKATKRDGRRRSRLDRKSTRLNSSHITISYAVFCLKKKKKKEKTKNKKKQKIKKIKIK